MREKRIMKYNRLTMRALLVALMLIALNPFSPHDAGAQRRAAKDHDGQRVRSEMLISTDRLAGELKDKRSIVLHVARSRSHYDEAHIPGARFVGWSEMTATRDGVPNELPPVADLQKLFERSGIGDTARIVLYGDSSGLSAARLYFTLDYLGHGSRAALLDGGLEKWKSEKRPTSIETPKSEALRFTPRVQAEKVVSTDVMRDLSWTATNVLAPNVALVDARPAQEYTGAKPGDGITRPGHIPGAANVFWMGNVVSKENPVLRTPADLRRLYAYAGATPGVKIVTYCRTGGQAAHAYFALKYLGYDVSMYDGSFFEWSRAEGTPVATGSGIKN